MTLPATVKVYLRVAPGATVYDYYDFVKWTRINQIERITPARFAEWFRNKKELKEKRNA